MRFVDVMRGQPPSCWLSMTQWLAEGWPHPLPQEGSSPYADSRWPWLAQEHPLTLMEDKLQNVLNYSYYRRIDGMVTFIVIIFYVQWTFCV